MKKRQKGILDLSEMKLKRGRRDWENSVGSNIYYALEGQTYILKLIEYNKEKQKALLLYNGKEYWIVTSGILQCCFGSIIGTFVKDFRYEINQEVTTSKKNCIILHRFRDEKGKKSYKCKCVDCGNIRVTPEDYLINKGFVCNVCSDKISYPERIFSSVLKQLNIKYEYQKMFKWSKGIKFECDEKSKNRIYDFYIPSLSTIIEVNGELHYKEGRWSKSRPLAYVKENDKQKRILAQNNGVDKYIVINCMESNLEYIKNNILKCELKEMFDLSEIDWDECGIDASTSLMKICSDLWNNGVKSAKEIAVETGLSKPTVITYLKKFSKLGLNDYNPNNEMKRGAKATQNKNKKPIICLDNGIIFDSVVDCVKDNDEVFKEELSQSKVSLVCSGQRKHHRGYHFKYIEDLTDEEKIKYNIIQKAS